MTHKARVILLRATAGLLAPLVLAGVLLALAPAGFYLWIRALHLVAVMTWSSSMIGVIGLFAWHADAEPGSALADILAAGERRIIRALVNPAMVITWGLGLWLAVEGNWLASGWFHAKLVAVLLLSGVHGWIVGEARRLGSGERRRGKRFYLGVNAASVAFAVLTIILAAVKPM
jgi:putative membrane protein